jgi:hypothetical protein
MSNCLPEEAKRLIQDVDETKKPNVLTRQRSRSLQCLASSLVIDEHARRNRIEKTVTRKAKWWQSM